MDGDPYARMVAVIRTQSSDASPVGESAQAGLGAAPCRMRLGRVVSPVPLKVKVSGIDQPAIALRINERLTKGAKWKTKITSPNSDYHALSGPATGPVTTPHGEGALNAISTANLHSGSTTIDEAQVEQLELDLETGDQVLLLTEDDQIFFILMKVVSAV